MMKKSKFGFGKRQKRTKPGGKPRKKVQADRPGWERQPGQDKSGNSSSCLDVALLCASAGLPVVPLYGVKVGLCTCGDTACDQLGRHPRTKGATTDRALIKKYWTKWPNAKIGVVLGAKSGVLALVTEGSAGKKTLRALEEKTQ
jgi:Bifunctional DNA primase/polymerase, N-terminal